MQALLPNAAPFAVAYSGGGDSTAVLHALRNMLPYVFIVDHALRPESSEEAKAARAFAENLGLKSQILTWQHDNPQTGLQEKARQARYALLGKACRKAGIKYLVTGHTEDDQAETLLMRYDRGTDWRGAAGMREKAVAPIWPELFGVTLLRPALDVTRQDLRDYNIEHDLKWTDDPGNQNRDFTRIRARQYLTERPEPRADLLATSRELQAGIEHEKVYFRKRVSDYVEIDKWGIIKLDNPVPLALLAILLRAASGTGGPIELKKLQSLSRDMIRPDFRAATLADAMILKRDDNWLIGPDPARYKGRHDRKAMEAVPWPLRKKDIWDGRFLIGTLQSGNRIVPLQGNMSYLSKAQRACLAALAPEFRGSLPVILNERDAVMGCPGAALHPDIDIDSLVAPRLQDILNISRKTA